MVPPRTRAEVEARLIAAFRRMPSCPVYRKGSRIRTSGDVRNDTTNALEWGARFLADDPDGHAHLMAWARCQATGSPFSEQVTYRSWSRATAERGRRRAAEAIAAALNRLAERAARAATAAPTPSTPLDSDKTGRADDERSTEPALP